MAVVKLPTSLTSRDELEGSEGEKKTERNCTYKYSFIDINTFKTRTSDFIDSATQIHYSISPPFFLQSEHNLLISNGKKKTSVLLTPSNR